MATAPNTNSARIDLSGCYGPDVVGFKKRLARSKKLKSEKKSVHLSRIQEDVLASEAKVAARQKLAFKIEYPQSLPVAERASEIEGLLKEHQVLIVAGETGSGKTTQLPKMLVAAGCGRQGLIGHTQPRRLAARSVADRIASEAGVPLGEQVGFQVRFTDQASENTLVKVMTDGILLSEISHDRDLLRYDALIIDEAHERSLNIDFLLGYLKQLISRRKDLKIVITSATIDVDRFSKHFENAPVVEVSGRTYPVEVRYRPPLEEEQAFSLPEQICACIQEIEDEEQDLGQPPGDVLVFLPGEGEIRECARVLKDYDFRNTEIAPLYARLSAQEQNRIFSSHSGRRIVLSTNVAETSLTVPGIRYVVDSGLVRTSRYSYRSKIQRLPIEGVSQASANQRKGRCGRVAEGICYRLYDEQDFLGRPEFTDPEILRTNLASVILKMLDSGLGDVRSFPFIDMPDSRLWNDGFKLLFELRAVDGRNRLTEAGRQLAKYPIDPRLAKILITAKEYKCYDEALVIVSGLSIQDPRERPADKKQQADQAHARFKDEASDFVSLLKLWEHYEAQRKELSSNQLKKYCIKHYLNFLRMREWRDVHWQLQQLSGDKSSLALSEEIWNGKYEALHTAIATGFIGNFGNLDEKREYRGCRNRKFVVFPGSNLSKGKTKWVMSAEIVETQQVFARVCAKVEPQWLEQICDHVTKVSHSEPTWQKKQGQVSAFERVSLYGLDIVSKRRVNFGAIDPKSAREIFIRSALVERDYDPRIIQIKQNAALINELEAEEERTRRRDILVDDEIIYAFYDRLLPDYVVSSASLEKWHKGLSEAERKTLLFSRDDLIRQESQGFELSQYPDVLENNGIKFPLRYAFEPGQKHDGITISVPVTAIRQITAPKLERLVPGLLKEKCTQLIRTLPRTLRKHFVPVPDVVESIFETIQASQGPLLEELTQALRKYNGVTIPLDAWNVSALDDHLRFSIEVMDESGIAIATSKDLGVLAEKFKDVTSRSRQADEKRPVDVTFDSFNGLQASVLSVQAGIEMKMFPALQDRKTKVQSIECNHLGLAEKISRVGIARLYLEQLKPQLSLLEKESKLYKEIGLFFAPVGKANLLYDDFALFSVAEHFNTAELPRSRDQFRERFESARGGFYEASLQHLESVHSTLKQFHSLKKKLKGKLAFDIAMPMAELKSHIDRLVFPGFLVNTPFEQVPHLPRYIEAAEIRLEKMSRELGRERTYLPILQKWQENYESRRNAFEAQGIWDESLDEFRWLIEEQRVSWYAQQLGTTETVSEKRINKFWEQVTLP